MLPDRVSNPGPLTYESGALPIALSGPANRYVRHLSYLSKLQNIILILFSELQTRIGNRLG